MAIDPNSSLGLDDINKDPASNEMKSAGWSSELTNTIMCNCQQYAVIQHTRCAF